ncbi:TonB-dependent receptor [Muricauda sp. ANG21]|uniref:SusC/RagA family TonB-linked outer membrane protein n=1 Tax=Allomuricauda sp. ANG21 TaxID=3042468 RepID=UPI0034558629
MEIKLTNRPFFWGRGLLNYIMRIYIFLFCATVFSFTPDNALSQSTKIVIDEDITVSVDEVFDIIDAQTDYRFIYPEEMFRDFPMMTLDRGTMKVSKLLKQLMELGGFSFILTDNNTILIKELGDQQRISGTVTDVGGMPLPGASVVEKGTTNGTQTDFDGNFSLEVSSADPILMVSYIGFTSKEIEVDDQAFLEIILQEATSKLEEVVVVGYGTQRKADLTGAVSVADMDEVKDLPPGNIIKNLQGRLPGVNITTNGHPGSPATIRIRGIGTLNNNDPLYVIDGVPTKKGMHELNPNDIESVQVLKDASSASIYGSRAANGVVIITTKKAKSGKVRVDLTSTLSFQQYGEHLDVLNTREHAQVAWRAMVNDGIEPNHNIYLFDTQNDSEGNPQLNGVLFPEFIDPQRTMRPADTDWFDEVSEPSFIKNLNLTFSKGTEDADFLLSLGHMDNDGVIRGTNVKRTSLRVNSEFRFLNNTLRIGENFQISRQSEVNVPADDIMFLALVQQPIVPVHTVDGGWGGPAPGMSDRHNPVRLIEDNLQNKSVYLRPMGNIYMELEPVNGLRLRSSFGLDYGLHYLRHLEKSYTSGFLSQPNNTVMNNTWYSGSWVFQNTLTYDFEFKEHKLNFLAGFEQIKFENEEFSASKRGLAIEDIDYAFLDVGTELPTAGGSGSRSSLRSFFGKINYSYDDKYLLSSTVRRDGSSRFGKNYQYGIFPAFSLGWRVSEENFMENLDFVSDFKFRFGWGQNGNQEISNTAIHNLYIADYATNATWAPDAGTAYDIDGNDGGELPSGFRLTQQANPDLKWETTTQTNFGADFSLFDHKLTASVDYFIKRTEDILIRPPYLGAVGEGGSRWVNGASVENRGIEAIVGYQFNVGEFKFDLTANASNYKNEVVFLPDEVVNAYGGNGRDKNILGRSINSLFGYVSDGLFTDEEQVLVHAEQPGKGLGRIRYADINGDDVIDDDDRDWIGIGDPDLAYGFNADVRWRNFSLNVFFQGITGLDVFNDTKIYTDFTSVQGTNYGTRTLQAWSPSNPTSTIPALSLSDNNWEARTSTYFMESGSYLKLRNLQLGYSFPETVLEKLHLTNFRVFLQGQNLWTIKDDSYTGPDPENPGNGYPIPSIYTLGINVSL